jgi:asparagine synthase (glutamine-hydrolysing)
MCGIFGVVSRSAVDLGALRAATQRLRHRGPDGYGFLLAEPGAPELFRDPASLPDRRCRVALGHTRLAIIDLVTGDQPVANEDGTVFCMFNGEIYNYRELRRDLERHGHVFKTQSDTEVITHAYEEWDTKLVDRIEGMFAVCVYDARSKRLALFRDPLGIKPLVYSHRNGSFCFGSEIKALLAYDRSLAVSRAGVFDFLLFDQVPPPRTCFEDVFKLDAGELLVFDCAGGTAVHKLKYWDFRFDIRYRDAQRIVEDVEAAVERCVVRQSVADVPVGAFLSGGIDSSLVTRSLMNHSRTKAIHLHSDDEWSEYRWAMNPAFTQVERVNVLYKPTLQDCLDALATVDDPLRDGSILPTYLVCKAAARSGLKVILSGDGGDEGFAGYDTIFYPAYLFEKYRRLGIQSWGRNRVLYEAFRLLAGVSGRYSEMLEYYVQKGGYLPGNVDVENSNLLAAKKVAPDSVPDFRREAVAAFSCSGARYPDLELLLYLHYRFFLNIILTKVDFASMASSLEVRVPLLDMELVRLALAIPFEVKIRDHGKYPLKAVAAKHFGEEFARRPKAGFVFDFAPLFRDPEIEAYLRRGLQQQGVEEFLDVHGILGMMDVQKRSPRYGKKLWRALMFTEWFRNWAHA